MEFGFNCILSTLMPVCDGELTAVLVNGLYQFDCTGAFYSAVHVAPVAYTAELATEALFQGFMFAIPVLATVFGGRQILKMLR